MSPEQASGKPVTAATDVYALCAVAYCCLTGNPPFTGDNPLEVAVRHLHDDPPELPADVPGPGAALVMRSLAKDPAQRYPSAAALADAARAAATGTTPADTTAPVAPAAAGAAALGAVRPGPSTLADLPAVPANAGPPRRGRNRGAAVAGVVAVVVLAVAALTAALAFRTGDDPRVNQPATTLTTPGGAPATGPTGRDGGQLPPTRRTGNSPGSGAGPSAGTAATNGPAATPSSTGQPAPSSEPSDSPPPAGDPSPPAPSASGGPADDASATPAAAG
jgi:serine/threonine-protein kinase